MKKANASIIDKKNAFFCDFFNKYLVEKKNSFSFTASKERENEFYYFKQQFLFFLFLYSRPKVEEIVRLYTKQSFTYASTEKVGAFFLS